MATVHFLYRSTREKSCLEVRLQHTVHHPDNGILRTKTNRTTKVVTEVTEYLTNYIWNAKTKIEVTKEFWTKHNKKNSRNVDIKKEEKRVINLCTPIENLILEHFKATTPERITKDWLQSKIDLHYNPKLNDAPIEVIPTKLIEYIDYYLDYRKNELSESMRKKVNVVKAKLIRLQDYRKKTIFINDVNDSFKNEFVTYCKSKLYAQNTMQRELVFIKTFCKHARFLGVETHNQLDSLRIKKVEVESIYLTFEELEKIEKIDQSKLTESLDNAKDWLIISCYCGQRISDFMRFTNEMIRIENGKKLIEFTQVKTGKKMTVPLHQKIIDILDKRNGMFPYVISDQKYNDFIKVVCEIAELTQTIKGSRVIETAPESGIFRKVAKEYRKCDLVSSHIGRRSFASNYYGTIPTTYLIYVTGHSTESMFLTYIGKSNKDLALELTNYF